jgi:uncharacterized protein YoxC
MPVKKTNIITAEDLIEKLNELINQHNGLVSKVDELCEAVSAINQAVFEITGTSSQKLDS